MKLLRVHSKDSILTSCIPITLCQFNVLAEVLSSDGFLTQQSITSDDNYLRDIILMGKEIKKGKQDIEKLIDQKLSKKIP